MEEKEKAQSKFTYLKRQLYDLGAEAQALVNSIHDETETFLSDKDFSTMDFKKVEILSKELQQIQKTYRQKVEQFNKLKETFNFTE
jgi:hypothetical protein